LLDPDSGTILFKGERVWGPFEKLIPGHDAMKMVTQHTDDLNLFAKVKDNIAVLLPNTDLAAKKAKTESILQQLNMYNLAEHRVADLSGGQKQRVAIARAIVTQPEVLLLDEPFNQVDASFREGLQQDIRQIVQETGLTVVMVSHDPAEVLSMADNLLVLRAGEIIESGSPRQLYLHPKHLYTAHLLANCNVLDHVQAAECGITTEKDCVVIYPEWIQPAREGKKWRVKQLLFKGFYEDVLLERNGIVLRMHNKLAGRFEPQKKISLKITRYLTW
jgi:ABC-type sulfate/molybdate transport systems ATPase subunit